MKRKYPDAPRLAVGVLCFLNDRFLLIQRGQEPLLKKWTLPGGVVELGESLHQAAQREILQECHIHIQIDSLLDIYEYIDHDAEGGVAYHYVIIEYLASYVAGDLASDSDSANARWFCFEELNDLDTTKATKLLVQKAIVQKKT